MNILFKDLPEVLREKAASIILSKNMCSIDIAKKLSKLEHDICQDKTVYDIFMYFGMSERSAKIYTTKVTHNLPKTLFQDDKCVVCSTNPINIHNRIHKYNKVCSTKCLAYYRKHVQKKKYRKKTVLYATKTGTCLCCNKEFNYTEIKTVLFSSEQKIEKIQVLQLRYSNNIGKNKVNIRSAKKDIPLFCSQPCVRIGSGKDFQKGHNQKKINENYCYETLTKDLKGVYSIHDTPIIAVHRMVVSDSLGRPLSKNEIVLHIDQNNKNNHPSNLFLCFSRNEASSRLHGSLIWPTESNLKEIYDLEQQYKI